MFRPEEIIIHHSLTSDNQILSDIEAIRKYHIETNKWKDIAYHFVIESVANTTKENKIELITARPINIEGSHCIGHNHNSIGVCLIGNFDLVTPSEEMINVLVNRCLKPYMEIFHIPVVDVKGHREIMRDGRTCPGKLFDLDKLRGRLL